MEILGCVAGVLAKAVCGRNAGPKECKREGKTDTGNEQMGKGMCSYNQTIIYRKERSCKRAQWGLILSHCAVAS